MPTEKEEEARQVVVHLMFHDHVDKTDTCWLWTSAKNRDGYGLYGGKLAHRIAFIQAFGEYPSGTITDHLCRVRHCVNPSHLEAVTPKENIRRGLTSMAAKVRHAATVYCQRGHLKAGDNLYKNLEKDGYVHRKCKTCQKELRALRKAERETSRETFSTSCETS